MAEIKIKDKIIDTLGWILIDIIGLLLLIIAVISYPLWRINDLLRNDEKR